MRESEQTIRRYLLGELSESEQSALEARYFTDPQVFNEVLEIEAELVDGYARGQLANDVRERFEESYMAHPARSHRVKFAAALATRLDQIEEVLPREQLTLPVSWWQRLLATLRGRRPTLRFSMALATLLVMLGGVWIFFESRRQQQNKLAQTEAAREAEQQRREREQSQQNADQGRRAEESAPKQAAVGSNPQRTANPVEGSAPRSVALALTIGGVRGGDNTQIPTLVIPPGTTQARLLLNLKENNYSSYRASLQTIAGGEIFSQTNVKPRGTKSGASFVFTVRAHKFASGDYILTLRGVNPDGEVDDLSKSLFRVETK